ncbi:exodeoxyribonuclease VII large subunit [bacterium]|nr:exodeoxyribonuclease VII large subunit [bacterium]
MADYAILTVSQITGSIRELIENQFPFVAVEGEISNYKRHFSGHRYFVLKDSDAQLAAVIWKGTPLPFEIEEGMRVIAFGKITVYEPRGQYQIIIETIQPIGVGDLYSEFLRLKEKLEKAGYFNAERKKQIPPFPRKVGIVTASSGAALQDVLEIFKRRAPWIEMIHFPVRVQGKDAAEEITNAIVCANQMTDLDLLIVGRGGGSIEDLWAFNDENLATAILQSKIPVISAVGHETDFTIADFTADFRAATPSEAAEIASPDIVAFFEQLQDCSRRLDSAMSQWMENTKMQLQSVVHRLNSVSPAQWINNRIQTLDYLTEKLSGRTKDRMQIMNQKLQWMVEKLDVLNPESILSRGFSVVTDASGNILQSVKNVKPEQSVDVRVSDGSFSATVSEVKYAEKII